MRNKFSLITAVVVLGCLYSMPLYVCLGGLNTLATMAVLWFLFRYVESMGGENTWLRGLKDYAYELLCLGFSAW